MAMRLPTPKGTPEHRRDKPVLSVRVERPKIAQIDALAAELGVSRNQLLGRFVDEGMARLFAAQATERSSANAVHA